MLVSLLREVARKETKSWKVVFSGIRASHYFYARMLALLLVILTHIGILRRGWAGCHSVKTCNLNNLEF